MIHSIKVKNFLSFKDEVTMSFEATRDKHLEEYHVVEVAPGIRINKLGILFGANASGKTNLIHAIDTLRKFWLRTPLSKDLTTEIIPFLLDHTSGDQPSKFILTFYLNELKFVYTLHASDTIVHFESLNMYSSARPTEVFRRELKHSISDIQFNPKLKISNAAANEISVKCLNNMSVFAAFNQVNVHNEIIDLVIEWMKSKIMQAIGPGTRLTEYAKSEIARDEKAKAYVLKLLSQADYNISNIEINYFDEPLNEDLLIEFTKSGKISNKEKERIEKERTIKVSKTTFSHRVFDEEGKESIHELPDSLQSNGTLRTMGLASAMNRTIERDAFIPIDEIESSLHPKLVEFLIESFLKQSNYSQMLLTTHYDGLLEQEDLIRKDNIWFTRKKNDGSSELYSLADFSGLGRVSSLQKAYKYGKFSAVPNI